MNFVAVKGFFSKHSRLLSVLFALLVVFGLTATGYYVYKYVVDKDALVFVGGQKLTKTDYNKFAYGIVMAGTPDSPDLTGSGLEENVILSGLVESVILKKEAPSVGVNYSSADIEKYITTNYEGIDTSSDLYKNIYQYQEYLYLKEAVQKKLTGVREGKYVIARDDMYLPDPSRSINASDQEKIDKNILYSKKFIEDVYAKLNDKSITFDQAIELERNDSFIGENAPSENGTLHSGQFDSQDFADKTSILTHKEVYELVSKMKQGEVSAPIHLTTVVNDATLNVGWVIVELSKTNNEGGVGYADWFDEKTDQYKVAYRS